MKICTPRGLGQDPATECNQPVDSKVSMGLAGGGRIIWNVCIDHLNEIYHKLQEFKANDPIGGEKAIQRFNVLEYYGGQENQRIK